MPYYQRLSLDLNDDRLALLGRPGQVGAIHALRAYAVSRSDRAALLSLPTGYGKSELIALAPALFKARRTLIVAPTRVVRDMLVGRVRDQAILRETGIIADSEPEPNVIPRTNRITTRSGWADLAARDVVVAHPQALTSRDADAPNAPADLFDLIIFDEAHHLAAQSWSDLLAMFPEADAVGFSATPYRRDRRPLPGRVIFEYPLHRAVDDGLFAPIRYREIASDQDPDSRDRAVAKAAIAEHKRRSESAPGVARLLVRADTVDRAKHLAALYREIDSSVTLEVITHKTSRRALDEAVGRLRGGKSDGVAFVGVLGEGFDLPSLKLAAYHNPHRSLPVTIQFAGRIARAGEENEPAVLYAAASSHPEIVAELHRDNQRWDKVIQGLADEFARTPTKLWTVSDSDLPSIAEAFTEENFRTYGLAQIFELAETLDLDSVEAALEQDSSFQNAASPKPDEARVLSVIARPDLATYACLFERRHDVGWLVQTPNGYTEIAHVVLCVVPKDVGDGSWLMVRSTLPDGLTYAVLQAAVGDRRSVPGIRLARFDADRFTAGRFTSLGQRTVHPVAAGIRSYQTGAGKGVERSVSSDDRVLTAAGHAIATYQIGPQSHSVGVAFDSHKVWRHGYLNLAGYQELSADIADALENDPPPSTLAGLRIPGTSLSAEARPIAVELDVDLDPHSTAQFTNDGESFELRNLTPKAARPIDAGPIQIALRNGRTKVATITIRPNGTVESAEGTVIRDGRRVPFEEELRAHPIAIYFDDGSYLRGVDGHVAAGDAYADYLGITIPPPRLTRDPYRNLNETNQVLIVASRLANLSEKGPKKAVKDILQLAAETKKTSQSLLQEGAKQLLAEGADVVFCDDGTLEQADLIAAWRHYPQTGRPHLRLVHCKAKSERKLSAANLAIVQEVAQQVLRSVAFVLRPPDQIVVHCGDRAVKHPERFIVGDVEILREILAIDPIGRTNEMWILHTGLSAKKLSQPSGSRTRTLLGALRARLQNVGIDLAVVTSE